MLEEKNNKHRTIEMRQTLRRARHIKPSAITRNGAHSTQLFYSTEVNTPKVVESIQYSKDDQPRAINDMNRDSKNQYKKRSVLPAVALIGAGTAFLAMAYKVYQDQLANQNEQSRHEQDTFIRPPEITPSLSVKVTSPHRENVETITQVADVTPVEVEVANDSGIQQLNTETDQLQLELQVQLQRQAAQAEEIVSLKRQLEESHSISQNHRDTLQRELTAAEQNAKQLQQNVANLEKQMSELSQEYQSRVEEITKQTQEKLDLAKKQHEEDLLARLTEAEEVHADKLKRALQDKEHELSIKFNEDKLARAEKLRDLSEKVYAVEYAYQTNVRYLGDSLHLQKLTAATLALQQTLKTNGPFKPELDVLRKIAQEDLLVLSVLDSIPQRLVDSGVPKLDDLSERFKTVKKRALTASYSPSKTGFLGFLYAKAVSLFIFEERGNVEGSTIDARLARAEFYLQNRRLAEAIQELETIYGEDKSLQEEQDLSDVAFVIRDWVNSAKGRLVADQAVEVLEGHLLVLTNGIQ